MPTVLAGFDVVAFAVLLFEISLDFMLTLLAENGLPRNFTSILINIFSLLTGLATKKKLQPLPIAVDIGAHVRVNAFHRLPTGGTANHRHACPFHHRVSP